MAELGKITIDLSNETKELIEDAKTPRFVTVQHQSTVGEMSLTTSVSVEAFKSESLEDIAYLINSVIRQMSEGEY